MRSEKFIGPRRDERIKWLMGTNIKVEIHKRRINGHVYTFQRMSYAPLGLTGFYVYRDVDGAEAELVHQIRGWGEPTCEDSVGADAPWMEATWK